MSDLTQILEGVESGDGKVAEELLMWTHLSLIFFEYQGVRRDFLGQV